MGKTMFQTPMATLMRSVPRAARAAATSLRPAATITALGQRSAPQQSRVSVNHQHGITIYSDVEINYGDDCEIMGSVGENRGNRCAVRGSVAKNYGNMLSACGPVHENHGTLLPPRSSTLATLRAASQRFASARLVEQAGSGKERTHPQFGLKQPVARPQQQQHAAVAACSQPERKPCFSDMAIDDIGDIDSDGGEELLCRVATSAVAQPATTEAPRYPAAVANAGGAHIHCGAHATSMLRFQSAQSSAVAACSSSASNISNNGGGGDIDDDDNAIDATVLAHLKAIVNDICSRFSAREIDLMEYIDARVIVSKGPGAIFWLLDLGEQKMAEVLSAINRDVQTRAHLPGVHVLPADHYRLVFMNSDIQAGFETVTFRGHTVAKLRRKAWILPVSVHGCVYDISDPERPELVYDSRCDYVGPAGERLGSGPLPRIPPHELAKYEPSAYCGFTAPQKNWNGCPDY